MQDVTELTHSVLGDVTSFRLLDCSSDSSFVRGRCGVEAIYTPDDGKVEFIVFGDRVLCLVKSEMGYPAIYPVHKASFESRADAVLMDLDGTSVRSESFWIWIIAQTIGRLMHSRSFKLEADDEPHVSGHSVSEHLQYCINKYCPDKTVEQARQHYFDITAFELNEILQGRGRQDAFVPSPGLKEFLLALKGSGVKIGLVTSGLYEKAWPEIVCAFRAMQMGDPLDFYDAIISAGYPLRPGQVGTLGELSPKPHPWLYAETARVGLGIEPSRRHKVIGIEDSSAGLVSIRLAGFAAITLSGGNVQQSGTGSLALEQIETLTDAVPLITGRS